MPESFPVSWTVGFVIGLAAIALFSRERLNRIEKAPTTTRREKLLSLIVPGELRRGPVFRRAVLGYFIALTIIYTALAVALSSAGPPVAKMMGFSGDPDSAVFPISVALMILGLTPQFSPIERLENKARAWAFGLVGIPENFYDFTDRLAAVQIDPKDIPPDLLNPSEAAALQNLLSRAESALGQGHDYRLLEQSAIKLWAFREWLGDTTAWPPKKLRDRFRDIVQEIRPGVMAVIEDLEHLPSAASSGDAASAAAFQSRWRSVAERAGRATDDIAALFALFAEHAEGRPERQNPISAMLRVLIDGAYGGRKPGANAIDSLLMVLGIALLAAFAIALGGGVAGMIGAPSEAVVEGGGFGLGVNGPALFSAIAAYVFEMALVLAPAAYLGIRARRGWKNVFDAEFLPTRRLLGLALTTGLVVFAIGALYKLHFINALHMSNHPSDGQFGCVIWQYAGWASQSTREMCRELIGYDADAYIAIVWEALPNAVIASIVAVFGALALDSIMAERSAATIPRPMVTALVIGTGAVLVASARHLGAYFLGALAERDGVDLFLNLSIACQACLLLALMAVFIPRHFHRPDPAPA